MGAKKKGGAKKSGGSGESGGSTVALLGGGNVTFLTSVGAFFERLGREVDDEAAPDYFKWQVRWNGGWLVHVYCICVVRLSHVWVDAGRKRVCTRVSIGLYFAPLPPCTSTI